MKKMAILTFHRALNYGAQFQAYALMKRLDLYADAYILDYRCDKLERAYHTPGFKRRVKDLLKWIIYPAYMKDLSLRRKRFKKFDAEYQLSQKYTPEDISSADGVFDSFIVGSDQVWNPNMTGHDRNFFLAFAHKSEKYTYAASLGKATVDDFRRENIQELIEGMLEITVRENSAIELLKQYDCLLNPKAICDPVFLLSRNDWIQNLHLSQKGNRNKYIFIYIVAPQTCAIERARRIAYARNLEIKYIDAGHRKIENIDAINDAGPIEFLNLMLNAEMVITTSFHALALSMVFNIPFQYELSREVINANSRLENLEKYLGTNIYRIDSIDDNGCMEYDWDRINAAIVSMKTEGDKYLQKIAKAEGNCD